MQARTVRIRTVAVSYSTLFSDPLNYRSLACCAIAIAFIVTDGLFKLLCQTINVVQALDWYFILLFVLVHQRDVFALFTVEIESADRLSVIVIEQDSHIANGVTM